MQIATVLRTRLLWSNVIYGLLFISVGLLEVFYGYKYIRITLLVMGFLFWCTYALPRTFAFIWFGRG